MLAFLFQLSTICSIFTSCLKGFFKHSMHQGLKFLLVVPKF
jgi:hypothetical protein